MTPKRDHEDDMSMEEILASIRKFVSDIPSEDPSKQRVYKGDLSEAMVVPPVGHTSSHSRREEYAPTQSRESHTSHSPSHEPDVLDLINPIGTSRSNFNSSAERGGGLPSGRQSSRGLQDDSIMNLTTPLETKKEDHFGGRSQKGNLPFEADTTLGSSHAIASSASSLSRLAQASKSIPAKKFSNLADQRNLTLDQLIQDMVRPLVKQWIDTHLPTLVEEMVSKEIKRITKNL